MAFGYDTTTGWLPATYDLILDDLKAKYQGETTANTDVENGPAADMLRTVAHILKDAWDDQLGSYNSGFISAAPGTNGVAEGSSLELLLTPKIGPKLVATASTVVLPCIGVNGTIIPAGQTVILDETGENIAWSLDAEVTILGGSTDGTFTHAATGPKTVVAGSDWAILTPVAGWTSVGPNADDAIPGRNAETDAEYRQRYRESLLNNIIAAVRAVEGVTSASIIENPTNTPDAEWGLTHWFEVLVVGGDDEEIAEAIQATRAKGTSTVGNTTVDITDTDYVGGMVRIKFSRPELVPIYIEVTIVQGEDYPADDSTEAVVAREQAIRDAVVSYVGGLDPGENTSGFKIASYVNNNAGIPGIDNITVKVDSIDPPVNTGVLEADIREQFTIDDEDADIDVIGA
jgi:uncharacterized phage protein gp47/JayE